MRSGSRLALIDEYDKPLLGHLMTPHRLRRQDREGRIGGSRFCLIIDNVELYGFGSFINCLGRLVTSYTTRDAKEIAKQLAMVQ